MHILWPQAWYITASLGLLVTACGGGDPPHWSKQPLEPVAGTISGKSFTIDVPKGTQKSKVESKYAVDLNYHADRGGEDYVFAPSISIGWDDKKQTLDKGLEFDAKKTILHKDSNADGWVYAVENDAYPGKEDYIIRGEKYAGDGAFSCSVRIFPMKKGESVKELIPNAEAMCASIKAK
jgi:hypothetical protein